MKSLCALTLDGRDPGGGDPALILTELRYAPAEPRPGACVLRADRDGRLWEPARVLLGFEIHEENPVRRMAVLQRLMAWGRRGGALRTEDRPGKMLRVGPARLLTEVSTLHWADGLQICFTAAPFPFWQDAAPQRLQLSGTDESDEVFAPGYAADALVSARIAANAAVTQMTLSAGSSRIALTGLSLADGQTVSLGWTDDRHIFFIRNETTGAGLLGRRTADSSDELRLPAGRKGQIAVWANGRVSADFEVRGLYL